MTTRAFCRGCGGYVDLDENDSCPQRHPRSDYRDVRSAPLPVADPRPAPVPLAVPQPSRARPSWIVPVAAVGVFVVLALCAGSVVAIPLLTKLSASAQKPHPPYPQEQPGTYGPPTEEQKRWALALAAVLSAQNRNRFDTLTGTDGTPDASWIESQRRLLAEWWGVDDRDDLLDTLQWIEHSGHRRGFDRANGDRAGKGIASWDYGRYVALCRWGYTVGYLSEDEAWQRIMPVARLMQATYSSWSEYGATYVQGREYWSPRESNASSIREIEAWLVSSQESPWVQLPWDLDLKTR